LKRLKFPGATPVTGLKPGVNENDPRADGDECKFVSICEGSVVTNNFPVQKHIFHARARANVVNNEITF
jgi:hypothetical protein